MGTLAGSTRIARRALAPRRRGDARTNEERREALRAAFADECSVELRRRQTAAARADCGQSRARGAALSPRLCGKRRRGAGLEARFQAASRRVAAAAGKESIMAGSVNKVILIGNLGKDPQGAVGSIPARRSSTSRSRPRRPGATRPPASARRRPSGTTSWCSTRTSARSSSNIARRARRSTSRASCRPANGPTSRASRNTPPRSCCSAFAAN